jgi:hypothetical protein
MVHLLPWSEQHDRDALLQAKEDAMAPDAPGQGRRRSGGSAKSRSAAEADEQSTGANADLPTFDEAEVARVEAVAARDEAAAIRDEAVAARDEAVAARDEAVAAGGGRAGGGGSPTPSGPNSAGGEDSESLRREVHALVGQVEGLLSLMRDHIETWCVEDMRAGYEASHDRLGPAFGRMHAWVASGDYDESLREDGFAGEHLEFKRRGLWGALGAVWQAVKDGLWDEMPNRVGVAAQAGATVVGSVADALQLATPIKEVISLVPTACELFKRQQQG